VIASRYVRIRTGACGEVLFSVEGGFMRVRLLVTRDGRPYRKPPVVTLDRALAGYVQPLDAAPQARPGAPFA
jgi:hypothetical protein